MNRSDFFKKLGLGALAVVVAPKMLAEVKEEIKPIVQSSSHGGFQWEEDSSVVNSIKNIKEWEEHGDKLYIPYDKTICINDIYFDGDRTWIVMYYSDGNYCCMPTYGVHRLK
jgi:hypothetical protein